MGNDAVGRGTVGDKMYYAPRLWYTMPHAIDRDLSLPLEAPSVLIEFQIDWKNNPISCECDWEALDEHLAHLLSDTASVELSFASIEDASIFFHAVAIPKLQRVAPHLRFTITKT